MSRRASPRRVGWVDGRVLASADLRDESAHLRELRSRHLLEVHRTWGVVFGLIARMRPAQDGVEVTPGVAYDPCGAELVLADTAHVPFPNEGAGDVTLTISAGACGRPALGWVTPGARGSRAGVPLARLESATGLLDRGAARRAASRRRPRLHSGSLLVPWSDLQEADGSDPSLLAEVAVPIDPEGQLIPPRYFAQADAGDLPAGHSLFVSIAAVAVDGFTLRLLLAVHPSAAPPTTREGELTVRWMSIAIGEET